MWRTNRKAVAYDTPWRAVSDVYMTYYFLNVPSQKFPVTKITMQSKSHSLNLNVLSSVIEIQVSFDSDNYFYVKTWFE